jgi:hypothetical protein
MSAPDPGSLVAAIAAGQHVSHDALDTLASDERETAIDALLATAAGRRWLRRHPSLDSDLAGRLLAFEDDYRATRRDRTLAAAVERAPLNVLRAHAPAIAAGAAATSLWDRLAAHGERVEVASTIVAGADERAAVSTLLLLVLDPLDPYRLDDTARSAIAASALVSDVTDARGLAAEFLADHDPAVLSPRLEALVGDESERVRGVAWAAGLRHARTEAKQLAFDLLADESASLAVRRSALVAVGTALPTTELIDLLSYFVVHPSAALAADAAGLLDRYHRNPVTAEAARSSPHPEVREVAERLLDPLRGSPAAGGSRPGDPTRSSTDIYTDMLRQLEERSRNHNDTPER